MLRWRTINVAACCLFLCRHLSETGKRIRALLVESSYWRLGGFISKLLFLETSSSHSAIESDMASLRVDRTRYYSPNRDIRQPISGRHSKCIGIGDRNKWMGIAMLDCLLLDHLLHISETKISQTSPHPSHP